MDTINPFAILEVTLDENPNVEAQPCEDPLNVDMPSPEEFKIIANKILYNYNVLNTVTDEEAEYRCRVFKDNLAILKRRLHCTICDIHIGCYPNVDMSDLTHPLLNVLTCASCKRKYCHVDFAIIQMGKDVRCRWCSALATDSVPLRFCSQCPFGFCEKCISRNLPLETSNDQCWLCCVCNMRSLWEARATLWGLKTCVDRANTTNTKWAGDISLCCKKKQVKKTLQPKNFSMINGRNESYGINNYNNNNNNNNNNNYNQHNNNNNNQELIYYQQHQHLPPPAVQERFIIETASIKKKLAYISSLINRVQAFVDKTTAELTDYAKDEYLKNKVGNVASFVTLSAEQLAAACKTLIFNFEKQVELAKRARTEPQQQNGLHHHMPSPNMSNNHQMHLPVPQLLPIPHPSVLQQQQQQFQQQPAIEQQQQQHHQHQQQQHHHNHQTNNNVKQELSLVPKPVQNLASFSLSPMGQLTAQFVGFSADGTIAAHQVNSNILTNRVQLLDKVPSITYSPQQKSTELVVNNTLEPPRIIETIPTTVNDKILPKTSPTKSSTKTIRKRTTKKLQKKPQTTLSLPKRKSPKKKLIIKSKNTVDINSIALKKCFVKLTKLTNDQLKAISYNDGHAIIKDTKLTFVKN